MDFWSGLAQGTSNLPDEIGRLMERKRANDAAQALVRTNFGDPGQGQPPPQPAPHPAAALAAMAPQPQPQPAPAPMPMRRPMGPPGDMARPPMMPQRPPMPAPQPQAQPQPQPNPNLSGVAQQGQGIDFSNPIREANQTWSSIINSIKAANPGIKGKTLFDAAQLQVENIKGLAPTTKAIMQGQISAQKLTFEMQFKYEKLNSENQRFEMKMKDLVAHHADQAALMAATEEHMKAIDEIGAARERDYSRSVDDQHEDRQAAEAGRDSRNTQNVTSREKIAGENISQRDRSSSQRSKDSTYRSKQSFRGAQVRGGMTADPEPEAPDAGGGGGGNRDAQARQWATQHGYTIIRKRADGKYDARDRQGRVGVIG